jgi:sodium borate transporter 11
LALYTKVIYNICEDWKLDFVGMFACIGLWNSFFLVIYSITDASNLMKWCTRSTEEIFALFISMAFAVDAFRDVVANFQENYNLDCRTTSTSGSSGLTNVTLSDRQASPLGAMETVSSSDVTQQTLSVAVAAAAAGDVDGGCMRETSLLYLLLVLGTTWLGLSLYNFTKTPFLNASKRELLADCALPVSVLLMSFFGSYVFRDVKLSKFDLIEGDIFKPAPLNNLPWPAILGAMGLGFCLSLLFFMDQNIASAIVNSADNRMKKGPYHWDLMVIALLNGFLSFFGLPLLYGALPHSPLHVRAMADVEDRVYQGHVYLKIVCVRETRVTGILSHVLIGLSLLFINQLKLIPRPVLDGLFLYLAITALHSNQLFERIMLLVTEQAAYPPNHYIRTVPQRKVHLFTFLQLLQLAVLCGVGFAPLPYLKMVFPVLHLVMLPIRHKLVPYLVERKFLHSLDGH